MRIKTTSRSRLSPIYAVLAEFTTPEALIEACKQARAQGYIRIEAYAPFPVEGLSEALDLRDNRVAWISLLGGVLSGALGYFMQWYANVVDYPINVAGRPNHSWPAFIPVTFELTVLGAALSAAIGMLALNRLPMPYHPIFNSERFAKHGARDRFYLAIESVDPIFSEDETSSFLRGLGSSEVHSLLREEDVSWS